MAKRKNGQRALGRVLDLWEAPERAGEPLVCLATTFTFDATFFEQECLGRFLQMDTHPSEGESVGYLIEREEKLAAARVSVFVDRRHAGDKESLRWDVVPVLVRGGIQHAKLSLLCWACHIRVIITSANLTEPAYRKNVEVSAGLDASKAGGGPMTAVRGCLDFLDAVVDRAVGSGGRPGPVRRAREAITAARRHVRKWPDEAAGDVPIPVFGGLGRSVLQQVRDSCPQGGPPRTACVVAPFYEPSPGDRVVARALVDVLAKKRPRDVYFDVRCEDLPVGRLRVLASKGMVEEAVKSCGVHVRRVKDVQQDEPRPLHAKELWLESDGWRVLMVGSSNFTRAGLGVDQKRANIEANVVYRLRSSHPDFNRLDAIWPDVEDDEIDPADENVVWEPEADGDGDVDGAAVLPAAFEEAIVREGEVRTLHLFLGDRLPDTWQIRVPNGEEILTSETVSVAREYPIPWANKPVPFVLEVRWTAAGKSFVASWAVNAEDPARLPPPDALRALTLDELIEVLSSTRPLHKAVARVIEKRKQKLKFEIQLDPLKRVNTETYLLRRTQRVAIALDRMRERLERPVLTAEALEWRLEGPVGPRALAEAFLKEARQPGEAAFFLAELVLALKRVRKGCLADGGLGKEAIGEAIEGCTSRVRARIATLDQSSITPDMAAYIGAALAEASA